VPVENINAIVPQTAPTQETFLRHYGTRSAIDVDNMSTEQFVEYYNCTMSTEKEFAAAVELVDNCSFYMNQHIIVTSHKAHTWLSDAPSCVATMYANFKETHPYAVIRKIFSRAEAQSFQGFAPGNFFMKFNVLFEDLKPTFVKLCGRLPEFQFAMVLSETATLSLRKTWEAVKILNQMAGAEKNNNAVAWARQLMSQEFRIAIGMHDTPDSISRTAWNYLSSFATTAHQVFGMPTIYNFTVHSECLEHNSLRCYNAVVTVFWYPTTPPSA
tara:strand:+ start:452 stop:1264 length:813 start_codon:yes stop_codon:yes gene_type:complete